MFNMEKRRGDLRAALQYLNRACKRAGEGHFMGVDSDMTRRNGF